MLEQREGGGLVMTLQHGPGHFDAVIGRRMKALRKEIAIALTEDALESLRTLSGGSPGLGVFALRKVLLSTLKGKELPYTVTAADVEALGLTPGDLKEEWDRPMRDTFVVELGRE